MQSTDIKSRMKALILPEQVKNDDYLTDEDIDALVVAMKEQESMAGFPAFEVSKRKPGSINPNTDIF